MWAVRSRVLSRRLQSTLAYQPHQQSERAVPHITAAPPKLRFSDGQQAFACASTFALARGAAVLTACTQPWLVRNAEGLLNASYCILGRRFTEAVLRHTVYAHFVAGEDAEAIKPSLTALRQLGVGGILDYAAESDLADADRAAPAGVNQPSRIYPFLDEAACDANLQTFLRAVEAVKATTPDGFAACKVTALGDPQLLERVSVALVQLQRLFARLDVKNRGLLNLHEFVSGWRDAFNMTEDESAAIFQRIDAQRTRDFASGRRQQAGEVDVLEFTNAIELSEMSQLVQRCRHPGPLYRSAPSLPFPSLPLLWARL